MMHPHLFDASTALPGLDLVGGKAGRILSMEREGFRVPKPLAISREAFEAQCSDLTKAGNPTSESMRASMMDPALREALLASLPPDLGFGYAVRSSAVGEDDAEHSFAGQFKTVLGAKASEVHAAVLEVWASSFSVNAASYSRDAGRADAPLPMGVLIQPLLKPDHSGVAFGFDPVTGSRRTLAISSVQGLGEGLVSGELDADEFRLEGTKVRRVRQSATDASETSGLTDAQVVEIGQLVRRLEQRWGAHQDVEWCLCDRALHLLQTRPATTMHRIADPSDHARLWESANIVESYPGISSPLTLSFVRDVYGSVYREFCRIMGVEESVIAANETSFQMLGSLRGRIHYDLANWYRVLSLFPGYEINARFMEQMMGVREPLDPPLDLVRSKRHPWLRLMGSCWGMVRNWWTLPREVKAFHRRVDRVLETFFQTPLADFTAQELVDAYRHLERDLLQGWRAPLVNDFFAMIFHGVLRKNLSKMSSEGERLANQLLGGEGGIVSTLPLESLRSIADRCGTDPGLKTSALTDSATTFLSKLQQSPILWSLCQEHLARWGERCPGELKLESIPPSLDPVLFAAQLMAYVRMEARVVSEGAAQGTSPREAAQQELSRLVTGKTLRRLWIRWLVDRTRMLVKNRENLRFERTRAYGVVRRIFLELGTRLAREGRISSQRDVFFLTMPEIFDFVEGRGFTTDLPGLVALRKAEASRFAANELPSERPTTRGMGGLCLFESTKDQSLPTDSEGDLQGLGCSPGIVRARIRVVTDPSDAGDLTGRILVAVRTDPGWAPLFPQAMGILVERGSLLSHSAIVAREMGIPAVVSIPGLTARLCDGDLVEFDGGTGAIRILERGIA
ncbi:MAG: phosphoenolpyruvate synthase [Fibrobacteres bacterium]|nr:phosphoenolpyruvate synthase [Fibrobacterota bacterium]